MSEPYKEEELEAEEEQQPEYSVDLDNLPKQTHHWVKRGIVVSCEGGNHPSHRHFLQGKPMN